ncbi:MAG: hypothetical protein GAK37_01164 [Pseudomonas sp.]|nr:MAG: hypothetical protein GAK37_01164 [Pseudomonas sp.]
MQWHTLDHIPSLLPLYGRAALKRRISGTALPQTGLRCRVSVNPKAVQVYRSVCGFADSPMLPPTYPHILAFGLQMQLLTAHDFPFPLLGLIHLNNRIRVLRPLGGVTDLLVGVYAHNLQPHAKGATFEVITTVDDALGPLWEAESRLLCRGVKLDGVVTDHARPAPTGIIELDRWHAAADIGRRYAKVSGDYNPIHLSAPTARLFGFPRAIAHGLWNKARAVAALGEHLPAANLEIEAAFQKPVRLPGEVILLASAAGSHGDWQLKSPTDLQHITGQWRPIA